MRSSSGTRVGFALHKSRSYLKACVLSRSGSSLRASRGFPGGAKTLTPTFPGVYEQSHFGRSLETETGVDRFAKCRSVEEHHVDAARSCESDCFAHDASPVPTAAMGRLREHREKIRRGRPSPVQPWLDVHEPDTTARDGFPSDVDDEAGEPIRLHLRACPTPVRAVRGVEIRFRNLRDCFPHAPPMTDQEIRIPEGSLTDVAANHGARIRNGDLSLPHPHRVNLV